MLKVLITSKVTYDRTDEPIMRNNNLGDKTIHADMAFIPK